MKTLQAQLLLPLAILLFVISSCASKSELSDAEKKAQVYFNQGTTSLVGRDYKEALKNLLEAQKLSPKDSKILVNLAMAYYFRDQRSLAIQTMEKALEFDSKNSDALLNLGSFYQEDGKYPEAMTKYNQVLKDLIYPQQFRTYYNMALIQLKQNNTEKAKEYLNKSVAESESYCPAHYQLGQINYREKNYPDALENFKQAGIGTCMHQPESFFYKALTLESMGRQPDAIKAYEFVRDQFAQSNYFSLANYHLQQLQTHLEKVESAENQRPVIEKSAEHLLNSPVIK